ncbi:MAG: hypothetical protein AB9900_13290 [Humidesulfovibrio sp.]
MIIKRSAKAKSPEKGQELSAYLLNTDSVSLGGASPHRIWLRTGYAYSGGDYHKYGTNVMGRLFVKDILLAYANRIGVVAIGVVADTWDGTRFSTGQVVYTGKYHDTEYKIPVEWICDLQASPITASQLRTCLPVPFNRALIPIKDIQNFASIARKWCPGIIRLWEK